MMININVCVCECVCISFHRKGFSWLNKTINVMPEFRSAVVCWGNNSVSTVIRNGKSGKSAFLSVFYEYGIKYLCRCLVDNHCRDLQSGNCAKECQLNRRSHEKQKITLINFLKTNGKSRSIAAFLLTNLGNRSDAAQGQILLNCHYTKKDTLTREGLPNLV